MDNACLVSTCRARFSASAGEGWASVMLHSCGSVREGLLCPLHAYCFGSFLAGDPVVVAAQSAAAPAGDDVPPRGHEVLVVDDDDGIREALCDALESEGYYVRAAANGREALAQLLANPRVSVIVLDLMMPTMDGWTFRAEQKRFPDLAAIPVVVVTAGSPLRDDGACVDDAASMLRKPINLPELLSSVQKLC
jgi:CheY-like chemotaxis protein